MSIKAVDLNYVYGNGTAFEQHALFDVNFEIQDGEFVGIIGHTGSGKSTYEKASFQGRTGISVPGTPAF